MAGIIAEDIIAEVRQRTDIVQLIGQHVSLRRSGVNHLGLCPFHDERTPSFNVNAQRQFYHCFGCHESGDVFSFLMKVEGRGFTDVVEDLASRVGVELRFEGGSNKGVQRDRARKRSERQAALELNKQVRDLYRELLKGADGLPARQYLERRGITEETAAVYHLGYAPKSGSVVSNMLQRKKVTMAFAEKVGLVSMRRGGREGYYDRFWNRLIFPVSGANKEVQGFGGRLLGDGDGPKYINSPESVAYHKSEALYGLEQAGPHIRRAREVLLVEGNVDVIQMYQCGFENTVAPMGTALTQQQTRLLKRMADAAVAIFDGDKAGQAAAVKSVPTLLDGGLEARIATLPARHDPDTLLLEQGPGAMEKIIQDAVPAVDFLMGYHLSSSDGSIPAKARFLETVAPVVARLKSQVARELYAGKLATLLEVDAGVVRRAIRGERRQSLEIAVREAQKPGEVKAAQIQPVALHPMDRIILTILGILTEHAHLARRAEAAQLSRLLTNKSLHATYNAALEMLREQGSVNASGLLEVAAPEVKDIIARVVINRDWAAEVSGADPTRALDSCIASMELGGVEREHKEITDQIRSVVGSGDAEHKRTLLMRLQELQAERKELKAKIG